MTPPNVTALLQLMPQVIATLRAEGVSVQLVDELESALTCSAPVSSDFPVAVLPPLNDDLIDILGRPNFACAPIAETMRLGGITIKQRSENEQAAVNHMTLGHYLADPQNWRANVGKAMQSMIDDGTLSLKHSAA